MTPLLISNLVNIRYLSGLQMTAGALLMTSKEKLLFVDDRYTEKAKRESKAGVKVRHIADLEKFVKKYKRVRFESNDLTHARLERWKKRFRGTKLIPSDDVIEELRRKKRKQEIESMKTACAITAKILKTIPRKLRIGMSELDLSWQIQKMAREYGAEDMAFDTIVGFGPNSSRPHHEAGKRKLKKGDVVQIDMGVVVNGYCSDCSRVFFAGKPTAKQKEVHDLLVKIVKKTTKMMKPSVWNSDLDKEARKMLKDAGYEKYFLHSLGHGVGLEVHEGVNLSIRAKGETKKRIVRNEVLTTEPGIYFAGKWGMRVEDSVLVSGSGGKRLTNVKYS